MSRGIERCCLERHGTEGHDVPAEGKSARRPRLLSVVCPVFNEEAGIALFTERLLAVLRDLNLPCEIIFVEDDSPDRSLQVLKGLHAQHPEVIKVISLSRRFGHQASLAAGYRYSSGDAVVCLDSDLQHPPEMIAEMLDHWSEGYQIVYTRRRRQEGRCAWKEWLSRSFYRVLDAVSEVSFEEGTADFRLLDRTVVDALSQFEERNLFFRGLVNWIGYRRLALIYDAPSRAVGRSQYSLRRMVALGLEALFSFSLVPLRISHAVGLAGVVLSGAYAVWVLAMRLLNRVEIPGYTSLAILVVLMTSLNLLCLGITAEYIGRMHRQSQRRPPYLVKEEIGFESANHDRQTRPTDRHREAYAA